MLRATRCVASSWRLTQLPASTLSLGATHHPLFNTHTAPKDWSAWQHTSHQAKVAPVTSRDLWQAFHRERDHVTKHIDNFARRHLQAIGIGGYMLIAVQWCVDDMLMLRCFGVVCATSMAVFAYFQPQPLMVPVRFNILFIFINGLFIWRILNERRDLDLSTEEQALWDLGLGAFLTKVQLRELAALGTRREVPAGFMLAESGTPVQRRVLLVLSGGIAQIRSGRCVSADEPGDFWGELLLLEKSRWEEHKVTSIFSSESTILEWDADELLGFLAKKPQVRQRLQELWTLRIHQRLERGALEATDLARADTWQGDIICSSVKSQASTPPTTGCSKARVHGAWLPKWALGGAVHPQATCLSPKRLSVQEPFRIAKGASILSSCTQRQETSRTDSTCSTPPHTPRRRSAETPEGMLFSFDSPRSLESDSEWGRRKTV